MHNAPPPNLLQGIQLVQARRRLPADVSRQKQEIHA
jgi:hypothetical protein